MPTRPDAHQRIEDYLQAVEKQLAHRPAAVRQDILSGLRDHIREGLQHEGASGTEPTIEAVERILGAMDAPADFSEGAEEGPASAVATAAAAPRDRRWFLLALAFLVVNTYGVWKWTGPLQPTLPMPDATPEAVDLPPAPDLLPEAPAPLNLNKADQINLSNDRRATLRLTFNAPPDRDHIARFLVLTTAASEPVAFRLVGSPGANILCLETDPVLQGNHLNYALAAGLPSLSAAPPTTEARQGSIPLTTELALTHIRADSPSFGSPALLVSFTAFPDTARVADFITIDPQVRFTAETLSSWPHDGLRLVGDFKPGAVYRITCKQGLPGSNGAELKNAITRVVQFPNRAPALTFESEGRYLAPHGQLAIPVSVVNLPEWRVTLAPVFANNLAHLALRESGRNWWYDNDPAADLTGDAAVQTNRLVLKPNEPTRVLISLRDLTPDPLGVYWLEAGPKSRLIVVTDLGIAARADAKGMLVWVNTLGSAQPVTNAAVAIYARNNQRIAQGTTDAQGLVRFENLAADAPFLVVAQKGKDLSYLDLARGHIDQGPGLDGAEFLTAGDMEAALFTERGVYRPGETVFLQALTRDANRRAPKPFPALFRVRRPDGKIFKDIPAMLDSLGSATATVELPDYLPTGRYEIELAMPGSFTVLGSTTVALEDFVPPQIRVALDAPKPHVKPGETLSFGVRSEHLFGRAADGLQTQGSVSVKAVPFAPDGWNGWHFGDDRNAFATLYHTLTPQTLDADGRATFTFETSRTWHPPAALQLVQQATVIEAGGRAVSAYGATPFDAYPFYIGVKSGWEGEHLRVAETQHISVVILRPDGTPFAEKPQALLISLHSVTWNSVMREVGGGRYAWQSEAQRTLLQSDTLVAGGDAHDWSFVPDRAGQYELQVHDPASGASTRIAFTAASPNQDWIAWSRERPGRIDLAWDRERYHPGDTARLLVKAPFSGSALLTIESDRIREVRLVTLEKNTAAFDIPVLDEYAPNVYCALTLIRPAQAESVWSPHRALGVITLPVDRRSTTLTVRADLPATARPQSQLTTRLTVRDEQDQPVQGAVTIMAVDEGICLLTGFATPDPNDVFTAQRRLAVNGHDLYNELLPIIDDAVTTASAAGGDSGDALRRRLNPIKANRFKPTALWRAAVTLDAQGCAEVTLNLPEFTGELRLMAVAYNGTQAGSMDQRVTVKRDLVVQSALPRFLALGDVSDIQLAIYNEGASNRTAHIRMLCGGPLTSEPAGQTVTIAAGQSVRLPFRLLAGATPGKAICDIEVESGDIRYRDPIEIAVRPAGGLQVQAVSQVLAAGESVTLQPPTNWLPATVSQVGAISALPTVQWSRALDYLISYPYGCLEQTVSGAFPLLYAERLISRMTLPGSVAQGDTAAMVRAAILRVMSMQQPGGGFALWPHQRDATPAASLYGAHFLVEAQAAGFAVPPEALASAIQWLQGRLDRPVLTEVEDAKWIDDMDERAYACHILALAKDPDPGWNARLQELSDRLYFASRCHVAAALLLAGEPRQAVPILERMGMPTARTRLPGRVLNSDVRDASLLLSAWLDIDPAHTNVTRLIQFIESRRKSDHWGNTQDNAMALLALGKYVQRLPAERPFTGTLQVPGAKTRTVTSTQDVHWAQSAGDAGDVTIRNDGPGQLFLASRFEGVATTPEPPCRDGITLTRDVLDRNGDPMDPARLSQGTLAIVRLSVDTQGRPLENLVIEELLPAGWEIENATLATAERHDWIEEKPDQVLHRDVRDDRILIFPAAADTKRTFHYAVRAVTPGRYVWPASSISSMYEPEIRSVTNTGTVEVVR